MPLLSALLTQDKVVSPKTIDEAIQRQVISGGDFETNLLEVGGIGEDTLAAYCAAIHGLTPASRAEVSAADPDAVARVPAALAERLLVVPLRVEDGRLVLAASTALTPAARAELEAVARTPVEARGVTTVRLAWALWRYHQVPLALRLQKLTAKLQTVPPGPMPDEVTIPLTRMRPNSAKPSIPAKTASMAAAAFDAALRDEGPDSNPPGRGGPSTPPGPPSVPPAAPPSAPRVQPAAFLASMAGGAADRTVVPEGSPRPSSTNTLGASAPTASSRPAVVTPARASAVPPLRADALGASLADDPRSSRPPEGPSLRASQPSSVPRPAGFGASRPATGSNAASSSRPATDSTAPSRISRPPDESRPALVPDGSQASLPGQRSSVFSAPTRPGMPDASLLRTPSKTTAAASAPPSATSLPSAVATQGASATRSASPPAVPASTRPSSPSLPPAIPAAARPSSPSLPPAVPAAARASSLPRASQAALPPPPDGSATPSAPTAYAPPSTRPLPADWRSNSPSPFPELARQTPDPVSLPAPARLPTPSIAPQVTLSESTVSIPPPRGISLPDALRRLDAAEDRDAAVEVLLDHAHERFAYVALFVVNNGRFAGLAARGDGASDAALRALSLPASEAGVLRVAYESGAVEVVRVEPGTADARLRASLGRDATRETSVTPVRIGARVALLLWADDGAASPTALAVRDLGAFVQRCSVAFERVITRRKLASAAPPPQRSITPLTGGMNAPSRRPPGAVLPDRATRLDALRKAIGGNAPPASSPPASSSSSSSRVAAVASSTAPTAEYPATPPVDENEELVAEAVRAGSLSEAALATLVANGEQGLAAVFRNFPGTHTLNRTEALAKLPPADECGPVLRLAVAFRQAALPRLLAALDGPDPDARFCALVCLGDVVHPSALPRLLPKLTDADYPTRMAAIEVLREYRRFEEFDAVGRALRLTLRDARATAEQRRAAAHALGEFRDAEAVAPLVATLSDADGALATAAHRALVVITRQDFGTAPSPWLEWWHRAAARHRLEWLIDALLHPEPSLRHEASEELKRVTGQYFGYYFNLPRRERERGHQRYVEWWRAEGASRFAGRTSVMPG